MRRAANNEAMYSMQRTAIIMATACDWVAAAKATTPPLIISNQSALPHRSQNSCGISIDYLAAFSKSLQGFSQIPTVTHEVVKHIISFVCQEQQCKMVDIMPQVSTNFLYKRNGRELKWSTIGDDIRSTRAMPHISSRTTGTQTSMSSSSHCPLTSSGGGRRIWGIAAS